MLKKLFLTLLILSSAMTAYAASAERGVFEDSSAIENSSTLSLTAEIINFFDIFVIEAVPQLMESFRGLFSVIVTLLFLFVVFRWLKSGAVNPSELLSIFLSLGLVTTVMLAVSSQYYFNMIYIPLTEFAVAMPSYIVSIASRSGEASTLQGLFVSFDSMVSVMYDLVDMMLEQVKWYNGGVSIILQAGILYLVYTLLRVCFLWVFLQGVLSVFVMLIILPFGILFTPFSASRGLFSNIMKALFSYILQPTFAAIIIAVLMYAATDLISQATELLALEELVLTELDFNRFFASAILLGIVGIFMTMKSSEYSNQVMMGAISHGNLSMGKTASALVGGYKGGKAGAIGAANAVHAMGKYGSKMKNKYLK